MSMPTSLILAGCMAWSLTACSSGPPKPVLPDGLHRVPVNRVPPVPVVSHATPAAAPAASSSVPDAPAVSDTGDRS
jgi:hypothetical protein